MCRERGDVVVREAQMKERRAQQEDERDDRDEHEKRPAHDRCRDRVPPSGARRVRLEDRNAPAPEVASEYGEKRGQERQAVEHRARDDDRARDAHRREERPLIEEHPGDTDRDGEAGERDRASGRRHRDGQRVVAAPTAPHLLAESVRDEERVVDRDAQADERHHVQGVDGHVGHARDEEHPGDAADDREHTDTERYESGDDRAEDDEKQDEREREGDGLGAAKVLLQDLVEPAVDREHARGLDLQRVRPYEGSKLGVVVAGCREVVLDGDVDRDGVTALRDELCRVARRAVVRGDDRRDA